MEKKIHLRTEITSDDIWQAVCGRTSSLKERWAQDGANIVSGLEFNKSLNVCSECFGKSSSNSNRKTAVQNHFETYYRNQIRDLKIQPYHRALYLGECRIRESSIDAVTRYLYLQLMNLRAQAIEMYEEALK